MTWLWELWDRLRDLGAELQEQPGRALRRGLLLLLSLVVVWWAVGRVWDPDVEIGPDPEDASKVVILLHGHGVSKEGITGLGMRIHEGLPDVALRIPDAPHDVGLNHTWYPSFSVATQAMVKPKQDEHRAQARKVVLEIIEELTKDGVPLDRIYLAGFSQGATVASDVFLTEPTVDGLGGVISLSGGALELDLSGLQERHPTRFFISHGTRDRILGSGRSVALAQAAKDAGHEVEYLSFDGGHTVSVEVFERVLDFLR